MTNIGETIDILSMIRDNPLNNMSSNYESNIVNRIKDHFTTEEQKLFITNCYCYINYDNEKDFVVEFDLKDQFNCKKPAGLAAVEGSGAAGAAAGLELSCLKVGSTGNKE